MTDKELAEQFADNISGLDLTCSLLSAKDKSHAYRLGRYDGFLAGLKAGRPQWHEVADGKLPELDKKAWVIRSVDDDMPMVAKRHIYTSYGRTEWEWKCYWGSGFDLKQNEIFAWCEIPTFDKE